MEMDPAPKQATRRRTPRQLERKREVDKQTQRIKRESDKDRLIQIQADVQAIKRQMDSLQKSMAMILNGWHNLHDTHLGGHPPQSSISPPVDMLTPPDGNTTGTGGDSSSSSSDLTSNPVHDSYADCFEHTVYDALIEAQAQPRAPPIPRSPSLPDLLFMGEGENVVSRILIKMLMREGFYGMDYRLSPSLETLQDVPEWLQPTEIQNNTPHQIFTDFVPFPRLRNAMISGSVEYTREKFDIDYGRSVSVNWPSWKPLLVSNDSFEVVLNPDFEPHILNSSNWSLDADFARSVQDAVSARQYLNPKVWGKSGIRV
ncbi:Protein of unknown function DUF3425 [Penicillium concentricum]|uniref:BZIP domain-containing protein n=1 Tax=Penicillium concentricum TaxID=293559 RepID=A0A9W9SU50_9EURO|nr:Protein of unknown function DUF3425 [Penicillium concentricum]KAJ5383584.1 Protein of unknown function DUF3425 [Penicillium concentricum]